VQVAGAKADSARAGEYHTLCLEWQGTTEVVLSLPMSPRVQTGHNGAVALQRGPLVYSLPIGEAWRRMHEDQPYRELPHADWEIYATTPWNYALDVDPGAPELDVQVTEHPIGERPFSPKGAPVSLAVRGRRLPEWNREHGSAADAPQSPVRSTEPLESLSLVPYGCTNLRITEFPVLDRD
jgi:hypothetical protein